MVPIKNPLLSFFWYCSSFVSLNDDLIFHQYSRNAHLSQVEAFISFSRASDESQNQRLEDMSCDSSPLRLDICQLGRCPAANRKKSRVIDTAGLAHRRLVTLCILCFSSRVTKSVNFSLVFMVAPFDRMNLCSYNNDAADVSEIVIYI